MKTTNYSKLGHITTILSFLIGTCLFVSFKMTHNFDIASFGLIYIMIATLLNLIIMLIVLSSANIYNPNRKKIIFSGLLMLINIPIALLYLQLL